MPPDRSPLSLLGEDRQREQVCLHPQEPYGAGCELLAAIQIEEGRQTQESPGTASAQQEGRPEPT